MTLTRPRIELPSRYRVLRHVATGGMAAVYAASDEILGREVAIKVLADALGADDAARARFTREARAAARVSDHPNVVTIYDIGETESRPPGAFIVMELLTGGTVNDRLKAGEAIPHTVALRWLEQAASALDAAHATGMVHRDVKPANLLLDGKGTLKVADFGIATLASEAPLTQTGQVVGTAAYFSPEQALGQPATAASDRYALAVVAYELLTGRRPFPGGAPAAQAMAHVDAQPPAPTSVAPGLPDAVDAVLVRGLAKDPSARPDSAAELVAQLHGALGPTATTGVAYPAAAATAPMPPRLPTPRRRAAAVPVAPASPRVARPAPGAPRRRPDGPPTAPRARRTGVIAATAAVLLMAGAAVAALTGGSHTVPFHGPTTSAPARAKRKPTRSATTARPTTSPAGATTTASGAPGTTTAGSGAPADASTIQADAHAKIAGGDYNTAIGELRGLVDRCDVQITDPCAYAWFDLGHALRLAGDPAGAVSVLEHRLQNANQSGTVQAELDRARAAAAGGGDPAKGKGKGHGKKGG